MRRLRRIVLWLVAVLVLIPVLAVVAALVLLNIDPGRRLVERLAQQLTAGQVVLAGLGGRFPDALTLRHAEVHDAKGAWLYLDDVALDWSPLALLGGEARVDRVAAGSIDVPRLPVSTAPAKPQPAGSSSFSLPVRVTLQSLQVKRASIGAPVAGVAAVLALDGNGRLASLQDGSADVVLQRLDSPGVYEVHGTIDPSHLAARLAVSEPAGGLIAQVAKLPDLGPITAKASVDGPRTAEATKLQLAAGLLTAAANGTVDLQNQSANLDVSANAPAMNPAPGVSWQSVALQTHVQGPFTAPDATGTLRLEGVSAAGAAVASLAADLAGNKGAAQLTATATGVRIPGPKPDLLASAPLVLKADARLDTADRPVTFSLSHPLLQASGHATTGGAITATADLSAPDLQPLAAAGGVDLQGQTHLTVQASVAGTRTEVAVDGTLGVTGGQAPAPALLGDAAKIGVTAALDGGAITLSRAEIDGRSLDLKASGTDINNTLDVAYTLGLSRLADLSPSLEGAVTLDGTAKGATTDLAVDAKLTGAVGAKGVASGPLTVSLDATGLPGKPAGSVTAEGALAGAPVNLALHADRDAAGTLHATVDRADWKSLHAEGAATLASGATLPDGQLALRFTRLDDLRPFIGQPLSGGITATASLGGDAAKLDLQANGVGLGANSVGRAVLAARVSNPTADPVVAATLTVDGIKANAIGGSAKLTAEGPQAALGLRLSAALTNLAGADAAVASAATVDVPGKTVRLAALTADWKSEAVRLLAPAKISFGDGLAVDRLRIGLQQAVLDVAGQLSPTLNLHASLGGVTPDLAKPFAPSVDATGQISAEARLTGTTAAPQGSLRLLASNLHMRSGAGRALPPANLTASAQLAGKSANLDVRLAAGSANLAVTGRAPLGAGELALRAAGALDLALLDPILSAAGRRAQGRLAIDATVGGTGAKPEVNGSVTLAGGEVQDFAQGIRVSAINATVQASGQTVRIASFTGQAGPGTISASGTVGLGGTLPVDLTLTMRKARPLASDKLTATLDADLAVRGDVAGALDASGKITIDNAAINIPEHLPSSVAVLPVRIAGEPPPPPPKPGPTVGLDLQLDAPGQIFVRGRGLNAVLGGSLHVAGTTAAPKVSGAFSLRNGTFSLAGTTLTFSRGTVGFAGAGVTDTIDPSLDFQADSPTAVGTASLIVTGFASAPKITLSSSPPLPQDEVLSELLFGRPASSISPFQYASIAAALAQISGATGGGGGPLDRVRSGLGLDRLSVGGSTNANGSSNTSSATIEAGKYVANGVYVGAKQGTSGSQTQAVVQIDIYKGLKIETDVGSGAGGNSVGLAYQFQY